ncbi:MAG: hypothetical protein IPG22_07025 [Acidobacteria bacterium]|nr:hypothetical protein [Acidobacteriota bacterium]
MKFSRVGAFFIVLASCGLADANVTLPRIFSEGAVLQRDAVIPIWAHADPGENVTVSLNKQKVTVISDSNGKWSIRLKPEKAGGPFELTVRASNTVTLKDILIGEVWLCSGQSNMEWTVGQSTNAAQEIASSSNPSIRHLKVSKTISGLPQDEIGGGVWKRSEPRNTGEFSGVGYFFAKEIQHKLGVPVGLINASWGGTNIETWISREGFESSDEFREMINGMPKTDLDALSKGRVIALEKKVASVQGLAVGAVDPEALKKVGFDDARLQELIVPGLWESQSLGEMDGVVWLRKTIDLTRGQISRNASLELAKIDDNDVTYINGVEIGKTNQWDARRRYEVPAGVLNEGTNVIAVKVVDTGGGGGIYGDASDLKLVLGNEQISLAGKWKFMVESVLTATGVNDLPSPAYTGMVSPLINYAFRGVIWYQGESNAGRAYQYRKAFPLLINDWRTKTGKPKLPFYFVQLATFKTDGDSNRGSAWAELREAQTLTLSVPFTGMAVTTDVGNPKDIHPTNKQTVGARLAKLALNRTYKHPMLDTGPSYRSMKIVGKVIIVTFDNVAAGLATSDGSEIVKGVEIAGSDQRFFPATGKVVGNTIVVSSPDVAAPVAVRFGWIGDASANNLFNKEGFPAVPFRTDDWKTLTTAEKYRLVVPK